MFDKKFFASQGREVLEVDIKTMEQTTRHPDVTQSAMHVMQMGQQSRHMALGCADNCVQVVYYVNMQTKYKIKVNYNQIHDLYFTKNENYIYVVGNTKEITFISHVDKCVEMILSVEKEAILDLDMSIDNDYMVTVGLNNTITIIDIAS